MPHNEDLEQNMLAKGAGVFAKRYGMRSLEIDIKYSVNIPAIYQCENYNDEFG
jgi:hypothetical protein